MCIFNVHKKSPGNYTLPQRALRNRRDATRVCSTLRQFPRLAFPRIVFFFPLTLIENIS